MSSLSLRSCLGLARRVPRLHRLSVTHPSSPSSHFTFISAPDDRFPRYSCLGVCADESRSVGSQRRLVSMARQTGPTLSRLLDRDDLARRVRNRQSPQTSQSLACA